MKWRLLTVLAIAWQPIVYMAMSAGMMNTFFDTLSISPNISGIESAIWCSLGFLVMESPVFGLGFVLWYVSRYQ